jgi:hypothetical protein
LQGPVYSRNNSRFINKTRILEYIK